MKERFIAVLLCVMLSVPAGCVDKYAEPSGRAVYAVVCYGTYCRLECPTYGGAH